MLKRDLLLRTRAAASDFRILNILSSSVFLESNYSYSPGSRQKCIGDTVLNTK
jgi:hypothetical protein